MSPELQGEIEKYLSKKNVYFKNLSLELQAYLELTYPNLPTIRARWYMLKNNMSEIPSCEYPNCSKQSKWNERNKQFDKGCCVDHIKRITSLKNFGTEHPNQSKKQQKKVKKSMQEKYGVDYITQTDKHKESVKETVREKYGVDYILQAPEIRDKIKQTNLERFGVEHATKNPDVREKVKKTNLKRFGVEESLAAPEVRSKIAKTNLEKYGSIFPMRNSELLEKRQQYIIDKYDSYSPLTHKENSEKYFHLDKSLEAENNGDIYYYFYEEELELKSRQIEWIKNKTITQTVSSIKIKNIGSIEHDGFITKNSLYNKDSDFRQTYGVFSNDELVAVFSGYENRNQYEITRYVSKIGIEFTVNIFEKFLDYIKKNKPVIISFDRRFTPFKQPFLSDAGFEFIGGTEPKIHNNVWDCGKLVYRKG